jgi:hypothetical protein
VRPNNETTNITTAKGDVLKSVANPQVISEERSSKDGKVVLYMVSTAKGNGTNYHSLLWCYFENGKPIVKEVLPSREIHRGPRPMFISALRSSITEGRKCKMQVGVQSDSEVPFSVTYAEVEVDLAADANAFHKKALERLEE